MFKLHEFDLINTASLGTRLSLRQEHPCVVLVCHYVTHSGGRESSVKPEIPLSHHPHIYVLRNTQETDPDPGREKQTFSGPEIEPATSETEGHHSAIRLRRQQPPNQVGF